MKVLQINAVNGIRSTGKICLEISDFLNNKGDEGYIAYADGIPYEKSYKVGTTFEKKYHGILSRISGMQGYFSKGGTQKLIKYIETINPEVIHLHNLHSNYINLKILLEYIAEKDIPTVLTLHDCWFYTGKCTHYTVDGCNKWQTGCGSCPRLKKDNPSWFFDATNKMFHDKKKWFNNIPRLTVVGVSDWIINEAKKSFLSSANNLTRIYNWVDFEIFKPVDTQGLRTKFALEDKFVILGIASDWSNAKGLDKFIELAKKIKDDMAIILVGNISENLDLPKGIIHIKETNNVSELVKYYSLADVFMNLSLEESFGKVTAEALACGTPVITLNSTANPELIGGNCGYILETYNVDILIETLLRVMYRKKEFYSDCCVNFAKEHFNKEDRLSDYSSLYINLIRGIRV